MNIALATDYLGSTGSPERPLSLLAEAGFTHLHWCHQWCTDFFYTVPELEEIQSLLRRFHLRLLDIHGSHGCEKSWYSIREYERRAGVLLIRNRMEMFDFLEGTGSLMMHVPFFTSKMNSDERAAVRLSVDSLRRSLDELMPYSEKYRCPIAVENMNIFGDDREIMTELLTDYPDSFLGICYDSGHGNNESQASLDYLDAHKDRLMALHLHDNDATSDLHQPPFYGRVDWTRLCEIIRTSAYSREISFELSIRNTPFMKEGKKLSEISDDTARAFLRDSYVRCERVVRMVRVRG